MTDDTRRALAPDRADWEQQPGETPAAYAAFRMYANLPYLNPTPDGRPGVRSLSLAAEALGKSKTLLSRWSAGWHWKARAEQFDVDQDREARDRLREAERRAHTLTAARRMEMRDDAWGLFKELRGKVGEMLAFPLFKEVERFNADGIPVGVERVPLDTWTPGTAATLANAAVRMGVLATDDGTGQLDRLLAKIDPEALTEDQVEALVNGADPIDVLFGARRMSVGDVAGDDQPEHAPERTVE